MSHRGSTRRLGQAAGMGLVLAALLSAGFVHRDLHRRRARPVKARYALDRETAQARLCRRPLRWRTLRHRRRARGGGWDRGRSLEFIQQHFVFGAGGRDATHRLSTSAIHRVMRRHDQAIARCLMKHNSSSVTIKLQIRGTGQVSIVTTDLAGVAARCVKGIVLKVKFPAHSGGRTNSTYKLKLN